MAKNQIVPIYYVLTLLDEHLPKTHGILKDGYLNGKAHNHVSQSECLVIFPSQPAHQRTGNAFNSIPLVSYFNNGKLDLLRGKNKMFCNTNNSTKPNN